MPDEQLDGLGSLDAVVAAFRTPATLTLVLEGPDFEIAAASPALAPFMGADRPLLGLPYREALADVIGQGYLEVLEEVFHSGRGQTMQEWRVEYTQPDGSVLERYINMTVDPWREPDGTIRGVVGQGLDVTDQVVRRLESDARDAASLARYERARDVVHALQDTLLPDALPVLAGVQTSARYVLASGDTSVGGDWVDVVALDDGRVGLVVGDVVGHGVPAAAAMGQLRAVLLERLAAGAGIPASLEALDRVADRLREAHAATVAVVDLDPVSGRFVYCTAGHPPPLVVQDGDTRYLVPSGAGPVGSGRGYALAEDHLGPAEALLLYSDGIIERPGRDPSRATVELATVAARAAAGVVFQDPGSLLVDRLTSQPLELLTRGTGLADDATLLAAQRVEVPTTVHRTVPAGPGALLEVREVLGDWLDLHRPGAVDVIALQHAVGECVANVVEHAYRDGAATGDDAVVEVQAHLDGSRAVVVVADHGSWRERPPDPDEARQVGGRGLGLVRGMIDHVEVERTTDGTRVVLRHVLSRDVVIAQPGPGLPPPRRSDAYRCEVSEAGVVLHGALDSSSADRFRRDLLLLLDRGGPVEVDLSEVTLLASPAVQVLFDVRATAGAEVRLTARPGSAAQHVLDLVHLPHG